MHLLALADTVSTCDADFAERFANNTRVDAAQNTGQEISPGESLQVVKTAVNSMTSILIMSEYERDWTDGICFTR